MAKWISKWFPIANALAIVYGWYKDWNKYDGWELAKAALCTFAGGMVGVVAGIELAAFGVTAAPVLIIGTIAGIVAGFKSESVKQSWCTPKIQPVGGQ